MKRKSFKQVASLVLAFLVVYTTIAWNGYVVEAETTGISYGDGAVASSVAAGTISVGTPIEYTIAPGITKVEIAGTYTGNTRVSVDDNVVYTDAATVTFYNHEVTKIEERIIAKDGKTILPEGPAHTDPETNEYRYDFAGWLSTSGELLEAGAEVTVSANEAYKAVYDYVIRDVKGKPEDVTGKTITTGSGITGWSGVSMNLQNLADVQYIKDPDDEENIVIYASQQSCSNVSNPAVICEIDKGPDKIAVEYRTKTEGVGKSYLRTRISENTNQTQFDIQSDEWSTVKAELDLKEKKLSYNGTSIDLSVAADYKKIKIYFMLAGVKNKDTGAYFDDIKIYEPADLTVDFEAEAEATSGNGQINIIMEQVLNTDGNIVWQIGEEEYPVNVDTKISIAAVGDDVTFNALTVTEYTPNEAALVNDTAYDTFEAAMAAATADAKVTLFKDVDATTTALLTNGITLDLAGHTLNMGDYYLGAFAGTNVVDSSVGGGLLKVAEGNLILPANNAYMPVYDSINEGYRLADVDVTAKNDVLTATSIYFMTRPNFGSDDIHALVADGAATCAAKVGVRLEWQGQNDGPSYVQDCFFTDAYLKEMYTNSKGATFKVSGVDKVVGFTATPIVLSDSGVKAVGTSYSPVTE